MNQTVRDRRLRVSANGRYFVDQQDRPFFYLGDTIWLIFQRLTPAEVEEYLADRAAKGFNVVQAYVLRGLGERHPDGVVSRIGAPPLIERDPTRLNEAYFRNVDHVVNRANERGFVMGLVASKSWHVNEHPERVFDVDNAYAFGKILGARYRDNAVIWFVGGDSRPGNEADIWVAMAQGLKDGSDGTQLVCYHGCGHTSSSEWFHTADWLDFNSIQSGHRWGARPDLFVAADYALTPPKPTVDMEPPYENHPTGPDTPRIDSHEVRRGAWAAMLSGAAGHGYGALDLFYLYQEDEGPFPRDGFLPWRQALDYEGSGQMGLMRALFEKFPWHRLVPDSALVASGLGEGTGRVHAARTDDGAFAVAYLPQGGSVGIAMDRLSGARVRARWYDPRDGSWRPIRTFSNDGVHEYVAPSRGPQNDWVLVLDAEEFAAASANGGP